MNPQSLVFVGAAALAIGVIVGMILPNTGRIMRALRRQPITLPEHHSSMRHVWSKPRSRLPIATRHAPVFLRVRERGA